MFLKLKLYFDGKIWFTFNTVLPVSKGTRQESQTKKKKKKKKELWNVLIHDWKKMKELIALLDCLASEFCLCYEVEKAFYRYSFKTNTRGRKWRNRERNVHTCLTSELSLYYKGEECFTGIHLRQKERKEENEEIEWKMCIHE